MNLTQSQGAGAEARTQAEAEKAAGSAAGAPSAPPPVELRAEIGPADASGRADASGASGGLAQSGAGAGMDESDIESRLEQSDAGAKFEETSASRLARRRVELGMSLDDVSGHLKFAVRQIEALEAGHFDKLPGGTFARGMVRSYARLLKVDPEPLLAQLAASVVEPQRPPEDAVSMRTPIPFSDRGRQVNVVYAVLSLLILVAVAYLAGEWYLEGEGAVQLDAAPAVSTTTTASWPAAVPKPAPVPQQAIVPSEPEASVPDHQARSGDPAAGAKRRIVLKFGRESWVEVKAGNGETLMSQLNRPGSERSVEGEPPLSLVIGNASSVQLLYNEKPVDLRPYLNDDVARLILD